MTSETLMSIILTMTHLAYNFKPVKVGVVQWWQLWSVLGCMVVLSRSGNACCNDTEWHVKTRGRHFGLAQGRYSSVCFDTGSAACVYMFSVFLDTALLLALSHPSQTLHLHPSSSITRSSAFGNDTFGSVGSHVACIRTLSKLFAQDAKCSMSMYQSGV